MYIVYTYIYYVLLHAFSLAEVCEHSIASLKVDYFTHIDLTNYTNFRAVILDNMRIKVI